MNEDREYILKRSRRGAWMGFTTDAEIPSGAVGDSPLEVIQRIDSGATFTADNMDAIKAQAERIAEEIAGRES